MDGLSWIALLLAIVLLGGLGYYAWQRRAAPASAPLGRGDRFAPTAALSAAEMEMLDYLVRAFPRRAVLFRVALSHLVTVRKADNRVAAQQRLTEHTVDYAVCNRDGRPVYAFELDALHDNAEEAALDAREKHRVLKSAGIRLIRLNRTTRDLPSPDEFRRHVRSAELTPDGSPANVTSPGDLAPADGPAPSTPGRARPQLSDQFPHGRAGGFRDTQPMTVTGLMGLDPTTDEHADAAANAWGVARTPQ